MKQLLAFFISAFVVFSSFTPNSTNYSKTFGIEEIKDVKSFVSSSGTKLKSEGWKYYYVSVVNITEDQVKIQVLGTQKMILSNSYCGPTYWNNPFPRPTGPQAIAIEAAVASYEQQGYNCVCTYEEIIPVVENDWTGHKLCVTVEASNTTECPCQI